MNKASSINIVFLHRLWSLLAASLRIGLSLWIVFGISKVSGIRYQQGTYVVR